MNNFMNSNSNILGKLKSEARFLILHKITVKNRSFVLYLIVRGIKGIEHLGFIEGTEDDVIRELIASKLMEEIKIILKSRDLDEHKLRNIKSKELTKYLLDLRHFIDILAKELVKLITSLNV